MKWFIIFLLLIPFASADILELRVQNSTIIVPQDEQILYITITKPILSDTEEMIVSLSIEGSAYFENQNKEITFDFSETPWESGIRKKIEQAVPIITQISSNKTTEEIIILANITYFNVISGYKKTNLTKEGVSINYKSIWISEEKLVLNELKDIEEQYGELETLNIELTIQNENLTNQVKSLTNDVELLKDEKKSLVIKKSWFSFLQVASAILLIMFVSTFIYYRKKTMLK